jgi:hypothetical protein
MALKDWKKARDDSKEIIYYQKTSGDKGFDRVGMFKIEKGALKNKWWIYRQTGSMTHQFPINGFDGVTKTQGLKFMKDYMRSH